MHWLTYHHFGGNWVTAAVKHGGCGGLRSWWRWWISSSFASWFSRKFWLCWWWWKFFLAFCFFFFFFFWIQLSWTWWCLLAGHALKQTISSSCYFHFWLVVEVFVLSLSLSLLKKVALVLKSLMKVTQKERLKLYDVGCLISLVQLIFS